MDFTSKVVLITGAAGGIGQELVKQFHQNGATVVLTDLNEERLSSVASQYSERVYYYACNIGDAVKSAELIKKIETEVGTIDILVNNAGLTKDTLMMRMKDEDWDLVLNVNLSAGFRLARDVLKSMMKKRYGRIISMASVVGVTGNPGQANYAASKAGLIAMTKCLAKEVATRGITVNCVAPGFIKTPMTDALSDENKEKLLGIIPVGRLGEPSDIANAVLFLADEKTSYITGQTIHVNGGMAMF